MDAAQVMKPMVSFLRSAGLPAALGFDSACREVDVAQRDYLLEHVRRHADTDFGRQHGFSSVRSVDDFRHRVPVSGYDAFSPSIDRLLHGARNILVPGRVLFFCATAGTTGYRKVVPVTEPFRRQLAAAHHLWLHGTLGAHPRAMDGALLWLFAPPRVDLAPDGTVIGHWSGQSVRGLPAFLRAKLAAPTEAYESREAEVRAYLVARCALTKNVTWLGALSSYAIHVLLGTLKRRASDLLRDVADGTVSVPVPEEWMRGLRRFLAPQPKRAESVTRRAEFAGGLTPRAAWPDLRLITCWTQGAGGAFTPDVMAAAPGVILRNAPYTTAEAAVGIPLETDQAAPVLALQSGFFEFIPVNASDEPNGDPLLAHELTERGRYNVVVTNGSGLARYRLDDIVDVEGFHARAPKLRFSHRAGQAVCAGGVSLTEAQARLALHKAMHGERLPRRWALVSLPGPTGRSQGRFHFLFEWAGPPLLAATTESLAGRVERALHEVSEGYGRARQAALLEPCTVGRVANGTLEQVWTRRAQGGHAGDEVKPTPLITEAATRELLNPKQVAVVPDPALRA
jgi:hypothetical protein